MKEIENKCNKCGYRWYTQKPETLSEKLGAAADKFDKKGNDMFRFGYNLQHGVIFPKESSSKNKFEASNCPKCNSVSITKD